MSEYTRRRRHAPLAAAALASALAVAACGGNDNTQAALSQDSALSRDIALAGRADSAAQPQLQDIPAPDSAAAAPAPAPSAPVAPAPAPRRETPRPAAARPAPARTTAGGTTASGNAVSRNVGGSGAAERSATGSIPAGTTLALTSNEKICTNTSQVGARFTASLAESVSGANGATIPAGATATVEVTGLDRSENARDKIRMDFRVLSVTFGGRTYAVDATTESADVSRVRNQPAAKDRQKVIGGAVIGAIAGQVIGKDTKGTVIGAATGAAAGAATAAATANYEGCLNQGAAMTVRLTDGVQVRI